MPNMTLSLDPETYELIKNHPGINWSHIARKAFQQKARELHMWDALLKESELTDEDALEAGDDAKKRILRRLGWDE
jgi:hypothetical protein